MLGTVHLTSRQSFASAISSCFSILSRYWFIVDVFFLSACVIPTAGKLLSERQRRSVHHSLVHLLHTLHMCVGGGCVGGGCVRAWVRACVRVLLPGCIPIMF